MARVPDSAILFRLMGPTFGRRRWERIAWAGMLNSTLAPLTSFRDLSAGTFSRADSTPCATAIGPDGRLYTSAANRLRIDYEPYYAWGLTFPDGSPRFGFRLEGQRANSCLWSEELNNAVYTADGTTVTANATTAPDGALTMDKLVETATTGLHQRYQPITITDSEYVAISCFVKAAERTRLRFIFVDGGTGNYFGTLPNLGTATVNGTQSGTGTLTGSRMIALPGGSYWVQAVGRLPAGVTAGRVYCGLMDAAGNVNYTGDGASGAYYWGVDVERLGTAGGVGPSTYIKTQGAIVTRASDVWTFPWPWSPEDFTGLAQVSRLFGVDVTGNLGINQLVYQIGGVNGNVRLMQNLSGLRLVEAAIDTAGTDVFPGVAIPAGGLLSTAVEYRDFLTGPRNRIDTGSGYGALSGIASALPAFVPPTPGTTPILTVGGDSSFFGVLLNLMFARGRNEKVDMEAALS